MGIPSRITILAGTLALSLGSWASAYCAEGDGRTDRGSVEQIVHDYLLEHPEVLEQALAKVEDLRKKESDARSRASIVRLRNDLVAEHDDPVAGDPKADVTIVEFFDYGCPYCKQVETSLQALLHSDPHLRIVYKEFPILGKNSTYAAKIGLAAKEQGKYLPLHVAMMTTKGQLTEEVVLHLATDLGLDVSRLQKEAASQEVEAALKRNNNLAEALAIKGTPAFIIGDELIPGLVEIDSLKEKIAALRKPS